MANLDSGSTRHPQSLYDYYLTRFPPESRLPRILAPQDQWTQPQKLLPNPLPEVDDTASSLNNLDVVANVSGRLCRDCLVAVADILNDSFPPERWRTIDSEHETVCHLIKHHLCDLFPPLQLERWGCGLCALIQALLARVSQSVGLSPSTFTIFTKPQESTRYQFYVCRGDVSRFIKHISEWYEQQAKPIRLLRGSVGDNRTGGASSHSLRVVSHPGQHILSVPKLPNTEFDSDTVFDQASAWLNDCLRHPKCQPLRPVLPKRVLDLKLLHQNNKVYLTSPPPDTKGVYATISYSWGYKYPRLQTKNYKSSRPDLTEESHRRGIAVKRFPTTLQHAIKIASRLRFRYVWIDSVCIVQDDKGDKDWIDQSKAMTQIYGGARLNISATSGENSMSGILEPIPNHGIHVGSMVGRREGTGIVSQQYMRIGKPLDVLDLEDKYLSTRGWVFQERLVSTATLHYTNEGLLWECAEGMKLAHDQGFYLVNWKKQWRDILDVAAVAATADPQSTPGGRPDHRDPYREEALRSWREWVAAYAERDLFKYEDRLHAMAGVATTLAENFGLTYAAGLWQEDLIRGLMWKRFDRTMTLKRFSGDVTPSWSWASVQGRLKYMGVTLKEPPEHSLKGPNMQVIGKADVKEADPGSFGKVLSGQIKVQGLVAEVVIDKSIHPGVRKREWQEVGVQSGFVNPVNVLVMLDTPESTNSTLYRCWCLRIGSYDDSGRDGDLFLLLEQVDQDGEFFRRVGFAEADAWHNLVSVTADSGRLPKSVKPRQLILV